MDIADFGTFDAECLCLTVDAFRRGALVVDAVVKRPIAVERHAHLAAHFPVDILDIAVGKLLMIAARTGGLRKEQGTESGGRDSHWYG